MPSRYNAILTNEPWVSTYTPLPLEMMAKIGAMKQGEHDKNVADIEAEKKLIQINTDPKHRAIRDNLLQHYNNQLADLADQYVKSDDPSIAMKVNQLKREFANDPTRLQLESNAANYALMQKESVDLNKAGKYDKMYNAYESMSTKGANDQVEAYDFTGMLGKEDYNTKAATIMGGIAKDGSAWDGYKKGADGLPSIGALGEYWKKGSSHEGVSLPKVVKIARDNAEPFLNTNEGRYFLDQYAGRPLDYNSLTAEQKDIAQKAATDYLIRTGEKQVGTVSKASEDISFLDKTRMDMTKQGSTPESGSMTNGLTKVSDTKLFGNVSPSDLFKPGIANYSGIVPGLVTYNGKVELDYSKLDEKAGNWSKFKDFIFSPAGLPIYATKEVLDEKQLKKQIYNIGVTNGWVPTHIDFKGTPKEQEAQKVSFEKQALEKVAKNLVYLKVNAQDVYTPPTSIKNGELLQMNDLAKSTDEKGLQLSDYLFSNGIKNVQAANSTHLGFDFSGDEPKFEITIPGSKESKNFTIANNSIKSALEPIHQVVKTNMDVILGKKKIDAADASILINDLSKYKIDNDPKNEINIMNLKPLSRLQQPDGDYINSYSDINNPGNVIIVVKSKDATGNTHMVLTTQSNYVQSEADHIFTSPELHATKEKAEEKQQVGY